MSRAKRLALIAAVVIAAAVAFIVLRPGDETEPTAVQTTESETGTQPAATTGTGAGSTSSETSSGPTTTETTPAPAPAPEVQRIRVRAGAPVGGVAEIQVRKGTPVRFVVVSDATEEVHVHGYDRSNPVAPGSPARFNFPATIEGVFEIELEHAGVEIARLVVTP